MPGRVVYTICILELIRNTESKVRTRLGLPVEIAASVKGAGIQIFVQYIIDHEVKAQLLFLVRQAAVETEIIGQAVFGVVKHIPRRALYLVLAADGKTHAA